ncbi:HAD family hydrolase [Niallia nealsonii]|uniref:Cof-type HAD-IIB family hydrolase n=1 Tax=Niallia nealsonii TaxID=115979 RepID=A0A2N0Z0B7_9BACI|nr:HAD family hydrolase [Niallia nealsonii]PKG22953.1 Cof-type HAD-IIB family hydrolase [Niallia nealsonii]
MKCVSIDLDGTLLNDLHQISDGNKNIIEKLKKHKIEVILNTGRQYPDVVKVAGVSELEVPIFCLNGSMMYAPNGELLYETTLSIELYKELLAVLQPLNVGILVYTNQGGFPATLPQLRGKAWEEIQAMFDNQNYESILHLENVKIYKLIAVVDETNIAKIADVKKTLSKLDSISFSSSFPNNCEITSNEAQKGKAIRRYENLKNLSFDEIYSFGDGGNDVTQFEVSTRSFAMENAPDEIKKRASDLTKSNNEDGVAYAIEHILKLV